MTAFAYEYSPYPIRPDIVDTYREVWAFLARPGCWYTGAEHVAMARAVRGAAHCDLCRRRKASVTPYSMEGNHDHRTDLPAVVVEVVHRVTTDSARLKRSWYEDLLASALTDAQYVEIVSVVSLTLAVDEFHHALGLPLERLPEAQPGAPSRYRPAGANASGAWVPMVGVDGATGAEADLYGGASRTANVVSALSLIPDAVRVSNATLDALYMGQHTPNAATNRGRALKRPQIELLAARVSAINDCFY